jgi:hypothetical protein
MRIAYAALEARSRAIGMTRLVCVAIVIVLAIAVGLHLLPPVVGWGVLGAIGLFVVLIFVHVRVDRARDRRDAAARFHERALGRSVDKKGPQQQEALTIDGEPVANHPYAGDLDMIGEGSVCAHISFVRTQPGLRTLREWLLAASDPPVVEEIRARQGAARALAKKPELVRALFVAGSGASKAPDKAIAFELWAQAKDPPVGGALWVAIAWVLPIVTIGAIVAGEILRWSSVLTWAPYAVAVVVGVVVRARVGRIASAVVAHEGGALAFVEAFDAALAERFADPRLASLQKEIESGRAGLRALRRPTSALDSAQNDVVRLFIAPIVMLELHAVLALERWRKKYGASAAQWFRAYGALEALASFGLLSHDFPAFAWPEISDEFRFDARALGHPLVPGDRRVCNDVGPLEAGQALVVTGSNMSGKSTLLRSIGVAAAMATAGAPVCAESLSLGRLRLATSMRVADSLAEGASKFYAELRRLKLVTEMAARGPGVLFLLDEMLYGTNARERLIGARATIGWLLEHGALGAVSTHDLALADLSGPLAAGARNVHFEEQVEGDAMSFDYKLREGVVTSSNALRLMRQLGLPVEGGDGGDA